MGNKIKELRKENNRLDEKLNKEYQDVLTDMIVYIRGSKISEYNQELVYQDLVTMMLDSQERGDKVEDLIGEDYKVFADNILKEIPIMTGKEKLLQGISTGSLCAAILFFYKLIFSLPEILMKKASWKEIPIESGFIISNILIILVSVYITKYVFRRSFNKKSSRKENFILGLIIFFSFAIIVAIQIFIDKVIFNISMGEGILILLLIIGIYKYTSN